MIEFKNRIVKLKAFKKLPEQYKTDKFCKLYYKMYSYIITIPKEKITIKTIVKRNDYLRYLFGYISHFIEAKDFYHWKDRIYSLITKQIKNTSKRKYELLYGSKAKEFFDIHINNMVNKCMLTNLEIYGVEHPAQSNIIKDKEKETWKNKSKEEKEQILEKRKITNLEKFNTEYYFGKYSTSYSKFGDEVCTVIDNMLGNPKDSIYYAKSGYEYCISSNTKTYYVDMVIPSLGLAFEADGVYFHGLIEGQEYVFNTPVEEIHKRDQEKTIAIEKAGYKLFRIREDEYYKNPKGTINILLKQIEKYVIKEV